MHRHHGLGIEFLKMIELGRSACKSAANTPALVILAVAEGLHCHMTYVNRLWDPCDRRLEEAIT